MLQAFLMGAVTWKGALKCILILLNAPRHKKVKRNLYFQKGNLEERARTNTCIPLGLQGKCHCARVILSGAVPPPGSAGQASQENSCPAQPCRTWPPASRTSPLGRGHPPPLLGPRPLQSHNRPSPGSPAPRGASRQGYLHDHLHGGQRRGDVLRVWRTDSDGHTAHIQAAIKRCNEVDP